MRIGEFFYPFQTFLGIVTIQVVEFNDVDQAVGITRVSGITCLLQATCPSLVIRNLQTKQKGITCSRTQEFGMVTIRILGMTISPETFIRGIVVGTYRPSVPAPSTLDTEMVVRLAGQFTSSGSRLQQSLCQRDTGRNMITLHLLHCNFMILPDVIFVRLILALSRPQRECHPCQTAHQNIFQ